MPSAAWIWVQRISWFLQVIRNAFPASPSAWQLHPISMCFQSLFPSAQKIAYMFKSRGRQARTHPQPCCRWMECTWAGYRIPCSSLSQVAWARPGLPPEVAPDSWRGMHLRGLGWCVLPLSSPASCALTSSPVCNFIFLSTGNNLWLILHYIHLGGEQVRPPIDTFI